jgi:predicted enzyme related to lactoylglutathione lyase
MPHAEKHEPGSFCRIELATTDQFAATPFYTSLFDWKHVDSPMGPNDYYTMFTISERNVAACYSLQPDQVKAGIPPHWNLYVSMDSADDTTARALECDGVVFCGPFDVATHRRMSTIADPTGAVFSVREPKSHQRIGPQGEQGSFCWADLSTPDPARAAAFYKNVFGWPVQPGDEDYVPVSNDCDAATVRARQFGANVLAGPMTIQHAGRMTVPADPQGAVFSLLQPLPQIAASSE